MAVHLANNVASYDAPQDATALKRVFKTITAGSCPKYFNFHMHTVCSDGKLTPEQLMEQAVQIGLRGLAITDHHSIQGFHRAQQWLDCWQQSNRTQSTPQLWTGVEINADLLNDRVHILGYAFAGNHSAIQPYLQQEAATGPAYQAAQVISAIHQAGGIAVLAHPARYRRSHNDLIPAAAALGIDGVETYYAYSNPRPWRPSPKQTQEVWSLGNRYSLLHTCGTDTHGPNLLERL